MIPLRHDAAETTDFAQTPAPKRPLWRLAGIVTLAGIFAAATETLAQTPSPSPSPSLSPSPSPNPQPGCVATATQNVTIAGGGGSFSPFSLTINAATRVTWTNVGNDRARVRDVDHNFLDSDDLQPGQSYSFTFCVSGTYQIEDARSGVRSTITVVGGPEARAARRVRVPIRRPAHRPAPGFRQHPAHRQAQPQLRPRARRRAQAHRPARPHRRAQRRCQPATRPPFPA